MEEDIKKWISSLNPKSTRGDIDRLINSKISSQAYKWLPGNHEDKIDYILSRLTPLEEVFTIKDKSDLKISFAIGYESQEVIDFLSEAYNVEVIIDDDPGNNKAKIKNIPDLAIFIGGEDLHPSFYGEDVGTHSSFNVERDNIESQFYNRHRYVPKLGIGRGAQFLAAYKGCKIIQHIENHDKPHVIATSSSNYDVESDHHQMIYPYNMKSSEYEILGWSKFFKSSVYLNGRNEQFDLHKDFLEVEIIQFNKNYLCFQPHPELSSNSNFRKKCLKYIFNFLSKTESKKENVEDDYRFELVANTLRSFSTDTIASTPSSFSYTQSTAYKKAVKSYETAGGYGSDRYGTLNLSSISSGSSTNPTNPTRQLDIENSDGSITRVITDIVTGLEVNRLNIATLKSIRK